jgi:hypothetical protein
MMAVNHLRMVLCEMEGIDESSMTATHIYFNSKSAMAVENSYKGTNHTHHIMHHYHYIRENITVNQFSMQWISAQFQVADVRTKKTPGF